jgi:hypothetical protein
LDFGFLEICFDFQLKEAARWLLIVDYEAFDNYYRSFFVPAYLENGLNVL